MGRAPFSVAYSASYTAGAATFASRDDRSTCNLLLVVAALVFGLVYLRGQRKQALS
ncbi:hypothetical protein [Streptomyces sp. NPDC051001]|uniref:hypothetical protein n=1 Tax=Streptomyces sp. NPDC051001 TaxID=3155795 RepID=UPI003423B332